MKSLAIDMTGQQIGRLLVVARAFKSEDPKRAYWTCRCVCGVECIVLGKSLRKSTPTRSCGCLHIETITHGTNHKHHKINTPEYRSWSGAKTRCYNTRQAAYRYYGGRGITMADVWLNDFVKFLTDMGPRPRGYTLERIDNNKGYQPGNCIWATRPMQAQNRRGNRMLTHNGSTLSTAEWERRLGFKPGTIKSRLQRGWNADAALVTPLLQ